MPRESVKERRLRPLIVGGVLAGAVLLAVALALALSSSGAAPANTAPPVISGSRLTGEALRCATGGWSGSPSSYAVEWRRGDARIDGASGTAYTPPAEDEDASISCRVTAKNGRGSAVAVSAPVVVKAANTANLWIAPDGGRCKRADDAVEREGATPCPDIAAAYAAAECGDIVRIADGAYGEEEIDVDPRSCREPVRFRAGEGETPSYSGIRIVRGAWMEFRDLRVGAPYMDYQASDITWRDISAECSFIRGADRIEFIGGTIGDSTCTSFWSARVGDSSDAAEDIVMEGTDYSRIWSRGSGDHTDNIAIDHVDGLTIRRSTFAGCENSCVVFGNDQDGRTSAKHVLVENSVFVCCYDGFLGGRQRNQPGDNIFGVFGDEDPDGFVFRFNTVWCANGCGFKLTDGTGADRGRDAAMVVDSNVFTVLSPVTCGIGTVTWRNNVAKTGTGCDGGTLADPAFIAEPATTDGGLKLVEDSFDLRLRPDSPAVGHGNQTDFPATDIDGRPRVRGRVDAGAYQTDVRADR